MISGKISQLKNYDDKVTFPVTSSKAVYMGDGSTTVEQKFNEVGSQLEHIKNKSEINVKDFGAIGGIENNINDTEAFFTMF